MFNSKRLSSVLLSLLMVSSLLLVLAGCSEEPKDYTNLLKVPKVKTLTATPAAGVNTLTWEAVENSQNFRLYRAKVTDGVVGEAKFIKEVSGALTSYSDLVSSGNEWSEGDVLEYSIQNVTSDRAGKLTKAAQITAINPGYLKPLPYTLNLENSVVTTDEKDTYIELPKTYGASVTYKIVSADAQSFSFSNETVSTRLEEKARLLLSPIYEGDNIVYVTVQDANNYYKSVTLKAGVFTGTASTTYNAPDTFSVQKDYDSSKVVVAFSPVTDGKSEEVAKAQYYLYFNTSENASSGWKQIALTPKAEDKTTTIDASNGSEEVTYSIDITESVKALLSSSLYFRLYSVVGDELVTSGYSNYKTASMQSLSPASYKFGKEFSVRKYSADYKDDSIKGKVIAKWLSAVKVVGSKVSAIEASYKMAYQKDDEWVTLDVSAAAKGSEELVENSYNNSNGELFTSYYYTVDLTSALSDVKDGTAIRLYGTYNGESVRDSYNAYKEDNLEEVGSFPSIYIDSNYFEIEGVKTATGAYSKITAKWQGVTKDGSAVESGDTYSLYYSDYSDGNTVTWKAIDVAAATSETKTRANSWSGKVTKTKTYTCDITNALKDCDYERVSFRLYSKLDNTPVVVSDKTYITPDSGTLGIVNIQQNSDFTNNSVSCVDQEVTKDSDGNVTAHNFIFSWSPAFTKNGEPLTEGVTYSIYATVGRYVEDSYTDQTWQKEYTYDGVDHALTLFGTPTYTSNIEKVTTAKVSAEALNKALLDLTTKHKNNNGTLDNPADDYDETYDAVSLYLKASYNGEEVVKKLETGSTTATSYVWRNLGATPTMKEVRYNFASSYNYFSLSALGRATGQGVDTTKKTLTFTNTYTPSFPSDYDYDYTKKTFKVYAAYAPNASNFSEDEIKSIAKSVTATAKRTPGATPQNAITNTLTITLPGLPVDDGHGNAEDAYCVYIYEEGKDSNNNPKTEEIIQFKVTKGQDYDGNAVYQYEEMY